MPGTRYTPRNTGDANLDVVQRDLKDVLDQLEGFRRGMLEGILVTKNGALQIGEGVFFRFIGTSAATWTLPLANLRAGKAFLLVIMNASTATLTVQKAGTNVLSGSGSQATGVAGIYVCDGVSRWHRVS